MAKKTNNIPSFDETEEIKDIPSFDNTTSLDGDEKKKPINEDLSAPLSPLPLKRSLEEKKSVSPYATSDIQSQSSLDGSMSESIPLQSDGIKSSYSVTPSKSRMSGEIDAEPDSEAYRSKKRADEKIGAISNKKKELELTLSRAADELKEQEKLLSDYEQKINDETIPEQKRAEIFKEYELEHKNYTTNFELRDNQEKDYLKLLKAESHLSKIKDVYEGYKAKKNSNALTSAVNFTEHVYNAFPSAISGIGSFVESVGDIGLLPPSSTTEGRMKQFDVGEKNEKLTDVIGGAIRNFGNELKVPLNRFEDEEHYIASTVGDIVGSIAVSAIPGSVAAKSGKAAQIISGATTATMQVADGVHEKAKELGLSDFDAAQMTLAIAPVAGLLEVWGATNIIDNIAGKKIINELVAESTKKLAGQKVTKELIFDVVSDTYKEIGKKYGKNLLKSGVEEGVTEGLQGELEAGAENIYDIAKGKEVYGTKLFSTETQLNVAKQAALGSAAGGVFGVLSGISDKKSMYETAKELKADPAKLAKFRERLNDELKLGNVTQEQVDNIKNNINSMIILDEKIPSSIKKTERRVAAVNLLSEKAKLEQDIEGKDKALTVKKRERIDEINSELENIARGRKLTEMPKKEFAKKDINLKPAEDAIPIEKTNEVDVRQQAGDGEALGEGNVKPETVVSESEIVDEKQKVIDVVINKAIEDGEIEAGSVYEKIAREQLSKRFDNKKELEAAIGVAFKGEEGDIDEIFLEKRNESPSKYVYKTSKGEYTVESGGGQGLIIKNKDGVEPSENTKLNVIKDYEKNFDYTKGKSAFEGLGESDVQESEADALIADKSENPQEIIEAHERLIRGDAQVQGNATEHLIAENIGKVKQKGRGGYNNFGDANNVVQGKAMAYFNEGKGEQIDALAQRLSNEAGYEITPQNIVDFIDKYPNGISDYTKSIKNPLITKLADRFKEVTGLTLNDRVKEASITPRANEFINQNFDNHEQFRESLNRAIDSGELQAPIEQEAEVADILPSDGGEEEGKQIRNREFLKVDEINRGNEKVSSELRGRIREAQKDEGDSGTNGKDQRKIDNRLSYEYANESNTWIDDLYSLGRPFEGGNEHTNAYNEKEQKVYKANNLMHTLSLDAFFDKIRLHNKLFPNTSYEFVGFTGIKNTGKGNSYVEPIYKQNFIKNAKNATPEEISDYMKLLGFEEIGDYRFKKDGIEVYDIRPRNVLKDSDGNIYVVDAEFKETQIEEPKKEVVPPPVKPPVNDGKKPSESSGQRVKSLATELSEAKNIPKEIRDKIKEAGLTGQVFSHEEAKAIANSIIESEGVEMAVDLADKHLKGSVKAFVFGAAIDHYSKMVEEAKTPEEKDMYAELGSDVALMFESNSEDYGRFISAIGEYYKNHPDIILKRETKRIKNINEKILENKVDTSEKINKTLKEFEKLKKEFDNKVAEEVELQIKKRKFELTEEEKSEKAKLKSKLMNRFNDVTSMATLLADKDFYRYSKLLFKEAADNFDVFAKEISESFKKIAKEDIPLLWDKLKSDSESVAKIKPAKELKSEQEKILNKYFPKKRVESETKRKQIHEKIIDQYNAGVFKGGVNKDGQTFESLFYEKLGIVNPDSKEVQTKLKEFADKIAKAPEGSVMWREANQDMLNYLANLAYQTKLNATGNKLTSMWYANILSSPATHLRNAQYNMIQTRILSPLLLAEKALVNKDPKAAAKIFLDMFGRIAKNNNVFTKEGRETIKENTAEARRVMWTGKGSRFDTVSAQNILERAGKFFKAFTIPGRALRAGDISNTQRAYKLKLEEQARAIVKQQNPDLTFNEINAKVNELIGETSERKAVAREKAQEDIEKFYGEDWAKVPGIETIKKIREFELMEQSMPQELKEKTEDVMAWAKRAVLTNKPTGVYGRISDKIQGLNDDLFFSKYIVPFINVPLNVAQKTFDYSPVGFIKYARNKEGFGSYAKELTSDQRAELLLKSINYTIAMVALAALNGDDDDDVLVITGEQTGDYTDNKGVVRAGGLKPHSLYVHGRHILSYKTSPLAAMLLPAGLIRDNKLYGKSDGIAETIASVAYNYLSFAGEQSAMQGVASIFEGVKDADKTTLDKLGQSLAKAANGMVPYSGAQKFFANNINALMGKTDKRPIYWYENFYRDLPFVTMWMEERTDHFGEPVKEEFDVPLVVAGHRGLLKDLSEKSKYYKLTTDHNYFPRYSNDRKLYVNGQEIEIDKKELNAINVKRGKLVKEALDSKNVFQIRHDEDEPPVKTKESEMTTYDYLNILDDEDFKEKMNRLYREATYKAKLDLYGEKAGISQKEIDNYNEKVKLKMDKGYSKSESERTIKSPFDIEKKAYEKRGKILIEVDNY
jgi:hypothetical protein